MLWLNPNGMIILDVQDLEMSKISRCVNKNYVTCKSFGPTSVCSSDLQSWLHFCLTHPTDAKTSVPSRCPTSTIIIADLLMPTMSYEQH